MGRAGANDGGAGEGDNLVGSIERVIGGGGNDRLVGNGGPNTLEGGPGGRLGGAAGR